MQKRIKTIPTLVGLVVLLLGIAGGVLFIQQAPSWLLRASPETMPRQVKITNLSESGFSVSWVTDDDTSGFIKYGSGESLSFTLADDRDQLSGKTGSFSTHQVTVKGLKASTNYLVKIGSGRLTYDNSGQPYQVTTAPAVAPLDQTSDVAHGKVTDQSGNPVEGAIVYLSLPNTVQLSALTKASGTWVIPLSAARSEDLSRYTDYDKNSAVEEIFVQAGKEGYATAVTLTEKDNPVETIILGGNFDFRGETAKPISENDEGDVEIPAQLNTSEDDSATDKRLEIINPSQAEEVNTAKPEFIGRGPVGETVKITLESDPVYTATVKVDQDGSWSWTPPSGLEPGEHTITVALNDGTKVSKIFTVLAVGSSSLPSLTASPSGTTATPTPRVTVAVTPTLTATPTPTLKPTATPTQIATRSSMPSTESGIAQTGTTGPTMLVLGIGAGLLVLGIISARKFSLFV